MEKDHALGGIVVGLLAGAVLGALIFSLSGSLDLGFGMLLILIVALASAGTGWFIGPTFMSWREKQIKPITERKEYRRIIDQSYNEKIDKSDGVETTRSFHVDVLRLGGLSLFFFILGVFFAFLTWYQGISYWAFVIFFAFLTLYNLTILLRNSSKSIEITMQGIMYTTKQGMRFIRWKEVDYIWEKLERVKKALEYRMNGCLLEVAKYFV